jgi:hypothetical protein
MQGSDRNAYKILVVKAEGNKPSGKTSHRWEGNIRNDLKE